MVYHGKLEHRYAGILHYAMGNDGVGSIDIGSKTQKTI